jgi:hypothetical protein
MSSRQPSWTEKRKVEELEKELKDTKAVLDHVLANSFKRKKTERGEKKKGN